MSASSMSASAAAPALLLARTPFLQLHQASSSAAWKQRSVQLWMDTAVAPDARLGALCWEANNGSSGRVPLHSISDVRIGKSSVALQSPAAADMPPEQCLSLQFTVVGADAVGVEYRGAQCALHSLDLVSSGREPSLRAWTDALLTFLETRLTRRLLSAPAHALLNPPIPSTSLQALEGGVPVVLHSRDPKQPAQILSTPSILWFNAARDTLFWCAETATPLFVERASQSLALSWVTDVFQGTSMHDPTLWAAVRASPAPTEVTTLTLCGSVDDSAPLIELNVQTLTAQAQQMLLGFVQYANELADGQNTVQSVVVVEVAPGCGQVCPRFSIDPPAAAAAPPAASPKATKPKVAKAAVAVVAAAAVTETASDATAASATATDAPVVPASPKVVKKKVAAGSVKKTKVASAAATSASSASATDAAPPAIPALPTAPPTAAAVIAAKLRKNGSLKRASKTAAEPVVAPVAPGTVHSLVEFFQTTPPEPEIIEGTPITINTTNARRATPEVPAVAKKKISVKKKKAAASLAPPSPMPVSSPAQVLSPVSNGSSSALDAYSPEQNEASTAAAPAAAAAASAASASASSPDSVYDPELDPDLDIELDFSRSRSQSLSQQRHKRLQSLQLQEMKAAVAAAATTTTTKPEETVVEEAKVSPIPADDAAAAVTAVVVAPVIPKKKKVTKKKKVAATATAVTTPVVASVDGDGMTVSLSPMPTMVAGVTSPATLSELQLPDTTATTTAPTPAATEISNSSFPPLPAVASSSSSSSSHLTAFQLALQTLEAGCAFTSLSLSDPNVVTSTLQKDKIFLWLNPRATVAAAAAGTSDDEQAGALFWCPLAPSRSLQTKVESPTRRLDVCHLADLFLGRQFGLFVARPELELLDDQACLSLVSVGEEETPMHLDLIAEDLHKFQQWMNAFNCMLQGETSVAAPTDNQQAQWDEDELTRQRAGGRGASMAPLALAGSNVSAAESRFDLEPTAEDDRISVPLDDAIESRTPQVQLSASMSNEAELHRMLLVAHHWSDLARLGAAAAGGLAKNIALGQWCVHRMREGVRVQRVDQRPGDSPVRAGDPLRFERSFLVYHDAQPGSDDAGCILSSRCEMDESFLLSDPAQSSPLHGSHTVATRDIVEVVLGQVGGAWEAAAAASSSSSRAAVAVPAVPHARCVSFIQASSASLDVEFDSLTHLLIWVLGLKFLLLNSADPVKFPLTPSSSTAAAPSHSPSSSSSSSSTSSLKSLPDPLRSLVDAFVQSVDESCVSEQWGSPITSSDGAFELLYQGAVFQAFAPAPSSDSVLPLSSHAVHFFYRFDDATLDGRYGSFYWNLISDAAASSPAFSSPSKRLTSSSSSASSASGSVQPGQFDRSASRRLDIDSLTAIMLGQMAGDNVLGAESLFRTHREEVREVLQALPTPTNDCMTLVGGDEILHLVWLRSMCTSPALSSLHRWVESLRALLARAGRGLVLEASAVAGARWLSVTGGPGAEAETESLPTVPSPFSFSKPPATQHNVTLAAASGPGSFIPPAQTPEYFDALALLERGRRFYSYSFLEHSHSTEPVVVRKAVVVYFSTSFPPGLLCDSRLFLLPQGEDGFPALWLVDDPNEADEDETLPVPQLQPIDMVFSRCLSLHEVTDLFCGTQSALWHSASARLQFAPSATATFDEEMCMTALAAAAPGVRKERENIEWNLETRTATGFGEWIDALSLMLPVHADGGDQQAAAAAAAAAAAKEAEATAAAQPTVLSILSTGADSGSPFAASMKRRSSWIEPLSPVSSLRRGCNFLLLRPAAVGEVEPLHSNRVQLFFLDADQMRSMGVRMDDASVFPASCLPLEGEDGYQGCLYWRPLSDAVFAGSAVRFDELHADQCMPLHVISDLYHGKETPLFRLSEAAEKLADPECFSLASRNGDEWNLNSLDPAPQASVIVEDVVAGIASLLERAGKGFADGDVAPEDDPQQQQQQLPLGSGTMITPPAARAAVSSTLPTYSDADLRSHGVSGLLPSPASPTEAHLLSAQSTLEGVLATLAHPRHVSDHALHLLGIILIYNHVAALEAEPSVTPADMLRLIHLGVSQHVVQSMMLFPQLEQLQELGCGILWMLSVSEEAEARLVEDGAIHAVVRALENHTVSVTVVAQAAGALRNLCVAAGHAEAIGDAGGLEALLAAMRSHASSAGLLHQCLGALASLALAPTNKSRFANLGGIEMILGIMRRMPFEHMVHLEGCAALRNLVAHNATNKTALTALGGLELLVKSFISFRRDRLVQLQACGALWNSTANHSGNKSALAAMPGGVEALLSTLATHGADEEVARECCGTLRNISSIESARPRLAQTGTIAACVDVQRRFPSSAILQFQCCALLFNMASTSSGPSGAATYADEVARSGGATTLAIALRTFMRRDPAVVEECCGALWMLTKANPSSLIHISASALVALSSEVLSLHANHAGVVKFASGMRAAWSALEKRATNGAPRRVERPAPAAEDKPVLLHRSPSFSSEAATSPTHFRYRTASNAAKMALPSPRG